MANEYGLTILGHVAHPERRLEVFPSRSRPGALSVRLHCHEFTCRCPVTGQPDWAKITIDYVPDELVVESKSMKLYLETYREQGIFHEHLAQAILDDLTAAAKPLQASVTVDFNVRGGIAISATATYQRPQGVA